MMDKLRKDLEQDEGVRYEVYLDHLSIPTSGIGHMLLETEPEYELPIGSKVSKQRVDEWFLSDVENCVRDCTKIFSNWNDLPEEAQCILANMAFNLGAPRLRKFRRMIAAIDRKDFAAASAEMLDSQWAEQVPNRARRLIRRMRDIA